MSVGYIREILSAIILLTPAIHCDYNPNFLLIIRPQKNSCKLGIFEFCGGFSSSRLGCVIVFPVDKDGKLGIKEGWGFRMSHENGGVVDKFVDEIDNFYRKRVCLEWEQSNV